MTEAFIHGWILAFGLILPLGVQNVFVFNQGAAQKRFIDALPVVLTASLCDTLLISLAVLGVSVVVLASFWIKTVLVGAGILFLLYMGWITWKSEPLQENKTKKAGDIFTPRKQIAFAASVSLFNPHAILDTVGVIGTSSLSYNGVEKLVFSLSCILVSWLWFTGLALAGRLTGSLDPSGRTLAVISKISALIMWGSAVYIGWSAFR
ncbi:LysE/ArgO family amino acid transporter [Lihuaxuella thermophila]|uniref:LysE/ArgO family amino acid transporter n=1 Tax=Lihuaxuella thermophila TaxID=1173111 RepID=UPI000B7FDEB4|nr:LysE/ArgO family amino acid transporter [Lihuaxuella thermophila]